MVLKASQFYTPRRILYGLGSLESIGLEAKRLGGEKALVVTDAGLRAAGVLDLVLNHLEAVNLGFVIFEDIQPNPTVNNVIRGHEILQSADISIIIGVGGGSVLDAAKMIAALATNGGHVQDYSGEDLITHRMMPLIAVNTTAGTGSEVTRWAVITDSETKVKMAIGDENIIPDVAINDPILTLSIPRNLTAGTGMDALTHAIEGLVGKNSTPLTDSLALTAINLITTNLRIAYADGEDVDARNNMMYAQMLAGMSFSNAGVGNVHAMAHQLGAIYDMPHGLANAVILPYVMEFNIISRQSKYIEIAKQLGEPIDGLSPIEAAMKSCSAVRALNNDLNIPYRLKECGIKEEDLKMLTTKTMDDGAMDTNPRSTTAEDMEYLWQWVFHGEKP